MSEPAAIEPSGLRRLLAATANAIAQFAVALCLLQAASALISWQFAGMRLWTLLTAPMLTTEANWAALFGMPGVAMLSAAVSTRFPSSKTPAVLTAAIGATVEFVLRFEGQAANPIAALVWRMSDHREGWLLLLASPVLCCVLAVLLVPASLVKRLAVQRPPK